MYNKGINVRSVNFVETAKNSNICIRLLQFKFSVSWAVKVHSHGAATAAPTVPLSIGFHWCAANYSSKMYGVTAAQNVVRTHLLAAPMPQPNQCEQVHLIQWNPIESSTVAAAVATPCERAFREYLQELLSFDVMRLFFVSNKYWII